MARRFSALRKFVTWPLDYVSPVWSGPFSWYELMSTHVRPDQRVPVVYRWLPYAWRPVRAYLRAGDKLLFCIWYWTSPPLFWLYDKAGLDPVVAQWEREKRDSMTLELSRPMHEGHGCRLDA